MTDTIRIACAPTCRPDCALRVDGCESRRWADVRLNHAVKLPVSPCCQAPWVSHGIVPWGCGNADCGLTMTPREVGVW